MIDELSVLLRRCQQYGMQGLKSEFESEGMRIDEFNLLNTLTRSNSLYKALKIGGSEAKTDMNIGLQSLSKYIIAPMIETPYSAKKCIDAFTSLIQNSPFPIPKLLINIETITALQNIDYICQEIKGVVSGLVFGRVDFTLSADLPRSEINSNFVNDSVLSASTVADKYDLEFVIGGGVNIDSIEFFKVVKQIRLDRFETRKCIISSDALYKDSIANLMQDCVLIELLWLKLKAANYRYISEEDSSRIKMLEKRYLYNTVESQS